MMVAKHGGGGGGVAVCSQCLCRAEAPSEPSFLARKPDGKLDPFVRPRLYEESGTDRMPAALV